MKKHAIIPIFIPHNGCPNDCVFCNQKNITARTKSPSEEDVIAIIERNLGTIEVCNNDSIKEIAFFGGSFTGIPIDEQNRYLAIAQKYKRENKIDKIRLSTRPDYIDDEILSNLKLYDVDIIEIGAQSFDDDVLRLSNRGHDSAQIKKAAELIKACGFELGIQLMTGLPGDTGQKSINSADMAISLAPSMVRIYPTVILEDTELKKMHEDGEYVPPSRDETVDTVKNMYKKFKAAGIVILRVGLKSTDLISSDSDLVLSDYHPAFRELVESKLALEQMEELIDKELAGRPELIETKAYLCFTSRRELLSSLSGHKKENRIFLEKKYPLWSINFKGDESLGIDEIRLTILIP